MPMRSIGYIGEKFNFNTVSYETALKATDKFKMREDYIIMAFLYLNII